MGDDWPGMGGSRLTGLPWVGDVATGVGKVRGDDGRPTEGAISDVSRGYQVSSRAQVVRTDWLR